MKTLNVGLVGAGFMGKAHVVAYSNMPQIFLARTGRTCSENCLRH